MARQKNKLLLICDEIIEGADNSAQIDAIDNYVLSMMEVPNFNDFGADKQHDKDFEMVCAILGKETQRNVKKLTVMEFYSLMLNIYKSRPKQRVKNKG